MEINSTWIIKILFAAVVSHQKKKKVLLFENYYFSPLIFKSLYEGSSQFELQRSNCSLTNIQSAIQSQDELFIQKKVLIVIYKKERKDYTS